MKLSIGTVDLSSVKVDKFLSIRNKPNHTGEELYRLHDKEDVIVLGRDKGGWYNISFIRPNSTKIEEGFVSDKFIKVKEYTTIDYKTTESIKLRKEPSWGTKNTIGVIKANENLKVLEIEGEWAKFYQPGSLCYAPIEFIVEDKKDEEYIISKTTNVYSTVDKLNIGDSIKIIRTEDNYAVFVKDDKEYFVPLNSIEKKKAENSNNTVNASASDKIISLAKTQLGKPYGWGEEGPDSFDCSGLVYYIFKEVKGVKLPRVTRDLSKSGKHVDKNNLQPCDLLFFDTNGDGIVNHVGIYIGNNEMIHSTKPGDVVKQVKINTSYWNKAYVNSRRY